MIWLMTDEVWMPVAERVQAALDQRTTPSIIITPEAARDLVVEIVGTQVSVSIEGIALDTPAAVLYLRDPIPHPAPDAALEGDMNRFVVQQWQIMLRGLMTALEAVGVPMINPVSALLVDEKTAQLVRAAQVGFSTPATLHGASGVTAEAFAHRHGDRCATKPFAPFVRLASTGDGMQRLLTNLASAADLRRGLDQATVASPTIVQPFYAAPYEHRVVVVGQQVFSARTARSGANAVDVRRLSPSKADVTLGELPQNVARRCIELVRACGLRIASLDLLEIDHDYVFLDLNPSGHFLWVEQVTGAPICDAIAALLASGEQAELQEQGASAAH